MNRQIESTLGSIYKATFWGPNETTIQFHSNVLGYFIKHENN